VASSCEATDLWLVRGFKADNRVILYFCVLCILVYAVKLGFCVVWLARCVAAVET
jgi:hypothetical protein